MKKLFVSFVSITVLLSSSSFAQDSEIEDEVIARGSIQTDPAMSAFRAGDYATAEIEFERNAFCALRATRNFRSGVEAAQDSTVRSDVGTDIDTPSGAAGGPGGVTLGPTPSTPTPVARLNSSDFEKNETPEKRTCEDRGFQIYMMGMSQLKLGKRAEAKEAFSRAVNMRKTLYDAHFRLGLLEYQDGNIDKANKQFKLLRKLESRCKGCDAKDEIRAQIQFMEKLLG